MQLAAKGSSKASAMKKLLSKLKKNQGPTKTNKYSNRTKRLTSLSTSRQKPKRPSPHKGGGR